MKPIYYLVNGPNYFRQIYKIGDYVVRVGTTPLDANDTIRGYREIGKVTDIRQLAYKSRYIYLYFVQFYDRVSQMPLYGRPIPVFGHDLVNYDATKNISYYYNLIKEWKTYYPGTSVIFNQIPGLKIEYANKQDLPLDSPSFGYDYTSSSTHGKDKKRRFKVGDRVVRKRVVYGSVGENSYGVVIAIYNDTKLPNNNKEHNQICVVNFKKDLDQVIVPSSELDLVHEGKSRYVTIESDKSKDKLKISNKIALILGQSERIDDRVAEDLIDFGSFTTNIKEIKVDRDSFHTIKEICKELID